MSINSDRWQSLVIDVIKELLLVTIDWPSIGRYQRYQLTNNYRLISIDRLISDHRFSSIGPAGKLAASYNYDKVIALITNLQIYKFPLFNTKTKPKLSISSKTLSHTKVLNNLAYNILIYLMFIICKQCQTNLKHFHSIFNSPYFTCAAMQSGEQVPFFATLRWSTRRVTD